MANVNVRRHLSEAEMWQAVGMVEQGATHLQAGDVFDVHHTVITRAWSRFQRYGTPVRRHGGGRERASESSTQKPFFNSILTSNWPSERLWGQYFVSNYSINVTWRWFALKKTVHTYSIDSESPQSTVWMGHAPCSLDSWRLEACPFYRRVSILPWLHR